MKKNMSILAALLIFLVASSFLPLRAQEKTIEEKEKELKIQEEIDKQKKAMIEHQRVQEVIQKAMESANKELDNSRKDVKSVVPTDPGRYGSEGRVSSSQRGARFNSFDDPYYLLTPGLGIKNPLSGDGGRSTWDFSKSVKESNFSREYTFDVERIAKTVVMSVTGECTAGMVRILIIMPDGKTYSDIVIDESGNLNWRKSFNISDEENKDKTGEWKYKINASDATGYFKISFQTF